MSDPVIQEPPKTVAISGGSTMFNDDVRRQLEAAYAGKAAAAAPVAPAAPAPAAPAPAPAPPPAAKPGVPAPPPAAAKPTTPPRAPDGKFVKSADINPTDLKKAEDWAAAKRAVAAEYEERIRELEAKAITTPADMGALDAIRKERDDLHTRLRAVAIERDPQFEREFSAATGAVTEMVRSTVGVVHADNAIKVLSMPPSEARDTAIEKLMESLPAFKQTQVAYALAEMDKLRHVKQAKIQESIANWDRLQAESRAAKDRETHELKGVFDKTLAEWTDPAKGLPILQKRDGDTEWNSKVDDTLQLARDIFDGDLEIDHMSRAALWAASAPLLLEDNAALLKQIEAKDAEIAALKGVAPGAGAAGQPASPPPDEGGVPANLSYGAAIAHLARQRGMT